VIDRYNLNAQLLSVRKPTFNAQLSSYVRVLESALSEFSDVVAKADHMRQVELGHLTNVGADLLATGFIDEPNDVFEIAESIRDDYLLSELGLRQGIVNLFCVGLYHLFEQQIASIFKITRTSPHETKRGYSFSEFIDAEIARALRIKTFSSWPNIEELRNVANCAKHGDGDKTKDASNWLRSNHPRLLGEFARIPDDEVSLRLLGVTQPLFGEGLCVSQQDFMRYADAIKQFWAELLNTLRQRRPNS